MDRKTLEERLQSRNGLQRLDLSHENFENIDFSGGDYRNIDFSWSDFVGCKFDGADFSYSSFEGAYLPETSCVGANFSHANLEGVNMRFCDMTGMNICGAFLKLGVFEDTIMKDIISDEATQYYRMCCPEKGPFLGYKNCFNDRLVTLLIPEDARRTSTTYIFCRTEKAKVLKITDFDENIEYDEAVSFVDENFVYRKGEMVHAVNFNPDRWRDSTGGIHFFMDKEVAKKYMHSLSF